MELDPVQSGHFEQERVPQVCLCPSFECEDVMTSPIHRFTSEITCSHLWVHQRVPFRYNPFVARSPFGQSRETSISLLTFSDFSKVPGVHSLRELGHIPLLVFDDWFCSFCKLKIFQSTPSGTTSTRPSLNYSNRSPISMAPQRERTERMKY